MTYTEIKFCQIDKPESHSFQLDFWNEIDGQYKKEESKLSNIIAQTDVLSTEESQELLKYLTKTSRKGSL